MYNEEIKKDYIRESAIKNKNMPIYGARIFEQVSGIETKLNKDCCEFTVREIILFYQSKCSASIESLNVLNNMLLHYTYWCMSKKMVSDNQNHYAEVDLDLLKECLNFGLLMDKIMTFDEVQQIMRGLDNPADQALILALFEGICGDNMCELVNMRCEDIDGNVITLCTGRKIIISDQLVKLCKESQNEYHRILRNGSIRELYTTDKGVFKNIVTKSSNPVNRKTLYNRLKNIKDDFGLTYLTTGSLAESGRICFLNNTMCSEGRSVDEILVSRETEYRYGKIPSISNWKRMYKEYVA